MAITPDLKHSLRVVKTSTWLDWQIDSNWTSPLIFSIYTLVKPLAATLIIVVMYYVVAGRVVEEARLHFMYLGHAFYMYVAQVLFSMGWVVHDDREHYQSLKYLYISPSHYYLYLVGRALGKLLLTSVSVILLLILGFLLLGIPRNMDILLFFPGLLLGFVAVVGFGITLASVTLLTARHGEGIGASLAGVFYLFSGAIFPLSVLPDWGQRFGLLLPTTYWFSIIRRSILGYEVDPTLGGVTDRTLLLTLLFGAIASIFLSVVVYKAMEYLGRKKGIIDMMTTY